MKRHYYLLKTPDYHDTVALIVLLIKNFGFQKCTTAILQNIISLIPSGKQDPDQNGMQTREWVKYFPASAVFRILAVNQKYLTKHLQRFSFTKH